MRRPPAPTLLVASLALAGACVPRATVTRRDATPAERTALVECASAIVTEEGFTVTERRKDLGKLSATSATASDGEGAMGSAPKGGGDLPPVPAGAGAPVDLLSVAIARHPLTEGIALRVSASAQVGDSVLAPSHRAAVARDRIIRSCAYLVG